MIPVSIDTSELALFFNLTREQISDMKELAVNRVAAGFRDQWRATAGSQLGKSRELYKNAIRIKSINNHSTMVYLDPTVWLANALELGYSSFDMKTGFLKSDKVKYTKSGDPYLTIPFRFATPDAIGDNPIFSGNLPKDIYSTAKSLRPNKSLSLNQIPTKYQIPKSQELRRKIQDIKSIELKDRTSIYEGLQKTKGGYINFRRVSLRSDAKSWIHPGFEERNIAGKALSEFTSQIPDIVGSTIDNFLDDLGL